MEILLAFMDEGREFTTWPEVAAMAVMATAVVLGIWLWRRPTRVNVYQCQKCGTCRNEKEH